MCSAWQVKDVAAHLLDTSLRRLSLHRDGDSSPHLMPGPDGLLPFLNRLNAEWTVAAYRLARGRQRPEEGNRGDGRRT
jgi:hypothetical protein